MSRSGLLEKTVTSVARTAEHDLFSDDIARLPGLLQALDPRVKVITFLGLILAVNLLTQLPLILAFYVLTLYFVFLGRVPLVYFLKRVGFLVPLFTGIVALPAIFNVVTPGSSVVVLANWGRPVSWGPFSLPDQLSITQQGLHTASILVLRVASSVSLGLLLLLTTPWVSLLRALRALHVPATLISILEMCHRYLFLLLRSASDMLLSRKSRTLKRFTGAEQRRWLGSAAGNLLAKSYQLSNSVYLAMVSRGYQGNPVALVPHRIRGVDWMWVGVVVGVIASALWFDRVVF